MRDVQKFFGRSLLGLVAAALVASGCATGGTPATKTADTKQPKPAEAQRLDANGLPLPPEPPKPPPPPPEPTVSERFAKAKALYDQKEYSAARTAFEKVLAKEPQNSEALFYIATSYDVQGDFDSAIDAYKKVIEAKPTHEGALLNLGKVYRRREQFDAAIGLYQKALEKDENNVKLRNNLGVVQRLAKKYDDAEKTLRGVLARNPGNIDAYKNMAVLFLDQNKLALAEQFSVEAKKLDENDSGIWNNLGLIWLKKDGENKPTRALGAFRKAVEKNPNDSTALMNIGAIALRYRDYATAEKNFQKAVDIEGNNPDAHLAYAYALDGAKKFDEAIAEFDKVTVLRGSDVAEVVFSKGMTCKSKNDWACVLGQFEKYKTLADKSADRLPKADEMIKNANYMLSVQKNQGQPQQQAPAPAPAIGAPQGETKAAAAQDAGEVKATVDPAPAPEAAPAAPAQGETPPAGAQ